MPPKPLQASQKLNEITKKTLDLPRKDSSDSFHLHSIHPDDGKSLTSSRTSLSQQSQKTQKSIQMEYEAFINNEQSLLSNRPLPTIPIVPKDEISFNQKQSHKQQRKYCEGSSHSHQYQRMRNHPTKKRLHHQQ